MTTPGKQLAPVVRTKPRPSESIELTSSRGLVQCTLCYIGLFSFFFVLNPTEVLAHGCLKVFVALFSVTNYLSENNFYGLE